MNPARLPDPQEARPGGVPPALLARALQLGREGPLHDSIRLLKEILARSPGEHAAAAMLADVLARLGRYEQAAVVLEEAIRAGGERAARALGGQLAELGEVRRDLERVAEGRWRPEGFLSEAIVPDGEGGYLVDSLGFPGQWEVESAKPGRLAPGAWLRLMKSLAHCVGELPVRRAGRGPLLPEGVIRVGNAASDATLTLVPRGAGAGISLEVGEEFLRLPRVVQRQRLARLLEQASATLAPPGVAVGAPGSFPALSSGAPRVLLVSLSLASDYGIQVLRDRLRDRGTAAECLFVRDLGMLREYLALAAGMPAFGGAPPHLVAVSVIDAVLEAANLTLEGLRAVLPDAWTVIGGPSSQTPEQLACLLPAFDVLLRGDADESLPELARVLGSRPRSEGLTPGQRDALRRWAGGIVVQTPAWILVKDLSQTPVPGAYHLPHPEGKRTISYWQTSRGCPYDCRFCYGWSGKRYRVVVPWRETEEERRGPLDRRSARAMVEWLVRRLADELDAEPSELEGQLAAAARVGEPLVFPGLPESIFIVIEDDDFLIRRERVREFKEQATALGLPKYFHFSAITSVRTLFRGGDDLDVEVIGWLKGLNFRSLDLGSDGLCQAVIDENQKGYTLDRHVIPANEYLQKQGIFAFNNTIVTTPYTTLPEFIETLIYYSVCPYPINTALEIGIMGHIGTRYTNEDLVNARFDWRGAEGEDRGHYQLLDNYRVPLGFPEYSLNDSGMISYADPTVRDLVLKFPRRQIWKYFSEGDLPTDEVDRVVEGWRRLPEGREEFSALGEALALLRERNPSWDALYAFATVKEEMDLLDLGSFRKYYRLLVADEVASQTSFRQAADARWSAQHEEEQGRLERAEAELRSLVERLPWYPRARRDLIGLLGREGKLAQAVEHFVAYQRVEPDLAFCYLFIEQLSSALGVREARAKRRAWFHIPRYDTLSPFWYLLARLKDCVGGRCAEPFRLISGGPAELENFYQVMDRWSTPSLAEALRREAALLEERLGGGPPGRVTVCGIPVELAEGNRLILDLRRVHPAAPVLV
ncbi:MAG: tetratricopeptide repeat protein [Deltaproteobacteria bacterium]|nr:tetratricopeptide repeat protein [Deltaproteobacteria bacterium]